MPWSTPSLADLRAQTLANFQARIQGADTFLPRAVLPIVANAVAAVAFAGYRALGWVARQFFVASAEAPYLDRRLAEVNLPRIQATVAAGPGVTFSGPQNTPIDLGTPLQTSNGGMSYTVTAAGTIGSGGTVSLPVVATTAGSLGNLAPGAPLTLVTAIAGVAPTAIVGSAGITGGTDAETDAAYRVRGLARLGQPPQGGAATDFLAWAKASGVPTRAWVFPLNRGIGTCDVAFTIDTRANNIPLTADLDAVQTYIAGVKPVIGDSQAFAPVADALAITILNLVGTGGITTAALQAAITAQLNDLIATVPPGGAAVGDAVTVPLPPGALFPLQTPGKLYLSQIEAAIEAAGSVLSYDLTAPTADVVFATGHLPAPPTITF
ncbi:MAG: baseplate J/gp47 family protein [Proteobacteria bacterium]|nr:baseplate J/gp47 family protein [Pseudomonadota bacterium]